MLQFTCLQQYMHDIFTFQKYFKNSKFVEYNFLLQYYMYCIAAQIEDLYCKASIPMVSHERIVKLIKDYHNKNYTLRKSFTRDKDKFYFKTKLSHFVNKAKSKLLDVASCKCVMNFACSCVRSLSLVAVK